MQSNSLFLCASKKKKSVLIIQYVTHHIKTGHLSITERIVIFLLFERAFYQLQKKKKKNILMCKLDAALQFYGQKLTLNSFYFLCFFPTQVD